MLRTAARWMAKRCFRRGDWDRALRWYRRSGKDGLTSGETIEYAALLHDRGESDQALRLLNGLLEREPHPGAYERRAHIYSRTGRLGEALADLDEAVRLNPGTYLHWYSRALVHNERGEFEEAARDFREALSRKDEARASTYFELGNVYMRMERFGDAEECFRLASEDPGRAIPHYYHRQAQALEALNRTEEALAAAAEAVSLHEAWKRLPDRGASIIQERTNYSRSAVRSFVHGSEEEFGFRMYESRLLGTMGRHEDALAAIERALPEYPKAAELLLRKGVLLRELKRCEESERVLEDVRKRNPVWLPVYLELCTTLRRQEKTDEAAAVLREAKSRFPDNTIVRYWLADALREAGRGAEAREENEALAKMEPDDPLNWKQQGELAFDDERFGDADAAYGRVLELSGDADAYMRRSFARYMLDRYEDALLDVQAAIERDPGLRHDGKTAYALAEIYVGLEKWELAEQAYSSALASEPDNPLTYDRRARCRAALDRFHEAVADCSRGLALDGSNTKLLWLRGYLHFKMDEYDSALNDTLRYAKLRPDDPKGHYNLGLVYKKLYRYDDAIGSFTKVTELNPFEPQAYLERASILYHHAFDRTRAADDLAQWMIYANSNRKEDSGDGRTLLDELSGFDDEMRRRAWEQYRHVCSSSRYLS